jgi:hypothetical protein
MIAMKKFRILSALLVLFSAISFTSCDTEPVDPVLNDNNGDTGPAVFTVDFSGETYTATSTIAVIDEGLIAISGLRGTSGEAVSIAVAGTTAGTYDNAIMSYSTGGTAEYDYVNFNPELEENPDNTGSVVITSINTANHTISGTFSFTAWYGDPDANLPTIAFTNGTFTNIPYTGGGSNPNPEGDEYFKAKIDGTQTNFGTIMTLSSGGHMTLGGTNMSTFSSIQLLVSEDITPGTYDIMNNPFSGPTAIYSSNGTESFSSTDGTLTIISVSGGWIKGTFSFTATDMDGENPVEVTNGEFNIEL